MGVVWTSSTGEIYPFHFSLFGFLVFAAVAHKKATREMNPTTTGYEFNIQNLVFSSFILSLSLPCSLSSVSPWTHIQFDIDVEMLYILLYILWTKCGAFAGGVIVSVCECCPRRTITWTIQSVKNRCVR